MRKYWLAGAAALALIGIGVAVGQQLSSTTLTGGEVVLAQVGIGGTGLFIPVSEFRNASALKTFSGSGAQTYQATVNDSTLYWVGTAPTTWTITTPVTPWDGEILQVGTDTTLTTMVTLTASTGQTLSSTFTNQTVTANTAVEWQYNLANTSWKRLH